VKIDITDLLPDELAEALDLKVYQARQLFRWVHAKQVFDLNKMTDLSKSMRDELRERITLPQIRPLQTLASSEAGAATRKQLFELHDGTTVEAVAIPEGERLTLCLSSQVGCAVRCVFCATGLSGYVRSLSPGEIVEQALHLLRGRDMGGRTPNIVFMGMGEPFRNYDAVAKAIRMLMRKDGLNIGARKITVSTAGDVPGIERFAAEKWQVRLSVSLHAANDALRSRLVPLNRKYPLARLMDAVRAYGSTAGRQVTFEWTLLQGVNDSVKDAQELAALIRGMRASVNLIPYNRVEGLSFEPSSPEVCKAFVARLEASGINATLRRERGGDINAACGQLRARRLAELQSGAQDSCPSSSSSDA
jgi:23S rRNA (adenine2503-C2)-methyltransferase